MNTSPLSIAPTASWNVGTTNYQPDFITAAGTASTGFTTEAQPKVGGVGAWRGATLLGTASALSTLAGCRTQETIRHPDGSTTIKSGYDSIANATIGAVFGLLILSMAAESVAKIIFNKKG